MSTSHITFRRRTRRGALALAVSAICLPSCALASSPAGDYHGSAGYVGTQSPVASSPASEYHGSAGYVGTHFPVAPEPKAGDTPTDIPGMAADPVVLADPGAAPEASGFDWTSAAIGAAGLGLAVVVVLGGATAASRIRMRAVRS
jgi:hypothetical protein